MSASGVEVQRAGVAGEELLTPDALELVAGLERRFREERGALLRRRAERRERLAAGGDLEPLAETEEIRGGDWSVAAAPADLVDRRVEITGPTDRRMTVNALNSGANVWLADFEDANAPHWANMIGGQRNLRDAIARTIDFRADGGRVYELGEELATIVVRPRGWHLPEKHVLVDGAPVSGSLFDFGVYMFHCAAAQLAAGSGPYFYLAKLEDRLEARLWNEVFVEAQHRLGLPAGTIRATTLIETISAAFEIEEILYELRDHASGLNAGRWDYLFSIIKQFRERPDRVLSDRNEVTMNLPFMRAYCERLVDVCHRRGAYAIGGMAAFIPSRRDPEVNQRALAKVRADKEREAEIGFDGSWVAHPDLVPVCREVFDAKLGERPNQLTARPAEVPPAAAMLDLAGGTGVATAEGLRSDVAVALRYLSAWIGGRGAVAVFSLMEDVATAEIARAQIWQWIDRGVTLDSGELVTRELVARVADEEGEAIATELGDAFAPDALAAARTLFDEIALADEFPEFLTLPAYDRLP